jgi:hypothetical protein
MYTYKEETCSEKGDNEIMITAPEEAWREPLQVQKLHGF